MRTYLTGVTATYLGGARIRFLCPAGHETVRDYGQGPADDRLSDMEALRVALFWDDRIRLPFTCRKCRSDQARLRLTRT